MKALNHMMSKHTPWNKGKLTGQKPALKLKEIWSIRTRLQISHNIPELALFNMAIDSKLRGCDLVKLKVSDISHGLHISKRAMIIQQKTGRSVQFELTEQTRNAAAKLIKQASLGGNDYLFKSQFKKSEHLSTRQYARIVKKWVLDIGLDPYEYGTHSLRRTKVSLIYRQTKNIRAIQLLLGHAKIESTVRYLGFEVDDALEMSENMDI